MQPVPQSQPASYVPPSASQPNGCVSQGTVSGFPNPNGATFGVSFYVNVVAVIDQILNDIPPIMGSFYFTSVLTNIHYTLFTLKQKATYLMSAGYFVPLRQPAVYTPIKKAEEYVWLQDLEMQLQDFVAKVVCFRRFSLELG